MSSMSPADLALGLRVLSDLLEAGLPVTRALQTLSDLAPAGWRAVTPHLSQSVREGRSLGAAFRDAPVEIPPLVIGMTVAGETAGNVAAALKRAAEITESVAETKAALHSALAYPAILALAGAGTIALMIGIVIPRFAAILADMGQSLPQGTRLLLEAAAWTRSAALPVLAALVTLAVLWRAWVATAAGRSAWHAGLLELPLLGTVRHASATARASVTLATLLETGVSLRQSLGFAARASGDSAIEQRFSLAGSSIESGHPIARSLAEQRALTPVALRLVQAGEESGRLPSMLRHAARIEQQRADRVTRTAVRLLEPALILVFASVVTLVAAALLQAVYSVRPTP